jgi:hypothetical protein
MTGQPASTPRQSPSFGSTGTPSGPMTGQPASTPRQSPGDGPRIGSAGEVLPPTGGRSSPARSYVLLKARPTAAQLRDRLAPPVPDGMELYIHEQDLSGDGWFERLAGQFAPLAPPPGFIWIVEGPVWSLDGELFGLCRQAEADREVTRRLVRLASWLGAAAVNIHCVDGTPDPACLSEMSRRAALDRAVPFLEWYVALCRQAGLVPLIENVPPICRMRRAAFIYTPIGVEPRDLLACVQAVPELRLTLDTSHAQLAVNAFLGVPPEHGDERLMAAARFYREQGGAPSLGEFLAPLLPWTVSVHVSNAAGLLAEGLPHDQGDADLEAAIRQLAGQARYFVTEPIDPDDDHAVLKRRMQRWLEPLVRGAGEAAGGGAA